MDGDPLDIQREPLLGASNVGSGSMRRLPAGYELVDSEQPGLRDCWLASVTADKQSSVFVHPHFQGQNGSAPRLLIGGKQDGGLGGPFVYGVLAPKVIRVPLLPGVRLAAKLKGLRLVGNQLTGCMDRHDLSPIVDVLAQQVRRGDPECIYFEDIEWDSALYRAISDTAPNRDVLMHCLGKPQPHWWIEFPECAEDYWKKFSKKSRYNLRAAAKKLEHKVLKFASSDDAGSFVELAHEISKASWQAKRIGLRIKNTAQEREWYERAAKMGALRSYVLEHAGRPIAFAVGLQWNGRFYYEEIGYDSAFAEKSPGTVLLFRLIEDLIAHDTPKSLDFGFGDAEYKRLFGTRESQSGAVLLAKRSAYNVGLLRAADLRSKAATQARRWFGESRAVRRLRQLYRQ